MRILLMAVCLTMTFFCMSCKKKPAPSTSQTLAGGAYSPSDFVPRKDPKTAMRDALAILAAAIGGTPDHRFEGQPDELHDAAQYVRAILSADKSKQIWLESTKTLRDSHESGLMEHLEKTYGHTFKPGAVVFRSRYLMFATLGAHPTLLKAAALVSPAARAALYSTSGARLLERNIRFVSRVRYEVFTGPGLKPTGRVQSVTAERNRLFYQLLTEFKKLTGVPILLNTSLNVMGKPIVSSEQDALGVFVSTGLDHMVVGRCVVSKGDK